MPESVRWLDDSEWSAWDRFAETHPLGGIVHTSAWKRVLEQSFPHIRGSCCVLNNATTGAITAGLPVYSVRSPLLGNRLVSIPFATLCDPLVRSNADMDMLLPALDQHRKGQAAKRIEIRATMSSLALVPAGVTIDRFYKHHYLPLDKAPEILRMSFGRTSVRQMITKAEGKRFDVLQGNSEDDLSLFYGLFCDTRRRLALPVPPYRFFQAMWHILFPTGNLVLLLARQRDRVVGGVLVLKWRDVFALEYSGDIPASRKDGVIQLLYWEALRMAYAERYKIFSFGRTSPNNKGLMDFKAHWGTQVEDLPTFIYPAMQHHGSQHRDNTWQYRLIRKTTHRVPRHLYKILSEFCYSHLG